MSEKMPTTTVGAREEKKDDENNNDDNNNESQDDDVVVEELPLLQLLSTNHRGRGGGGEATITQKEQRRTQAHSLPMLSTNSNNKNHGFDNITTKCGNNDRSSYFLRHNIMNSKSTTLLCTLFSLGFIIAFSMGYYLGSYQSFNYSSTLSLPQDITLRPPHNDNQISTTATEFNKQQAVYNKYGNVVRIALLGERNSGTTWITEELQTCFPTLNVTPSLIRHKHWFQKDDRTEPRVNTIVVAMFRNPYDWILAMRKRPHHASDHLHIKDYKQFVEKPWTLEGHTRPTRDLPYANLSGPICQEGFSYKEIIPCLRSKQKSLNVEEHLHSFSAWDPQYELNVTTSTTKEDNKSTTTTVKKDDDHGTISEPYKSILNLRSDKILNHLSIQTWDWISDYILIRYEDLLRNGTQQLISRIEQSSQQLSQCPNGLPSPPSPQRLNSSSKLRDSYVKYMNERIIWTTESLIGYEPIEV